MRHRDELDVERTKIDAAPRWHDGDRNLRWIALGSTLCLEQGCAEPGRIDRASQLGPEVDDRAEMVFVGVRQHQAHQVFALFFQKADVWHDEIDAWQMLLVSKRHPEIDSQPAALMAIAETVNRQVHADLADTAEWRKRQLIGTRHQTAPVEAAEPK